MPVTPLLAGTETTDGKAAVLDNSRPFSNRISYYLRPDLRLAIRKKSRLLLVARPDIQNVINRKMKTTSFMNLKNDSHRWAY